MKQAKLAAVATLSLLLLVVVGQNIGPVQVRLLLWGPLTLPTALLLFFAMLAGFLLGIAVAYVTLRRRDRAGPTP